MRLGIAYNFFNGEEHLLQSLQSVRSSADFVCLVAQDISNFGEKMTDAAREAMNDAVTNGMVNEVIHFSPDLGKSGSENERAKRAIGLEACRRARCTHFLGMDADEFYRERELEAAKSFIESKRLTITTVKSYFHLKRPIYRALDTTNVAFICRLGMFTKIGVKGHPASMVDPTRCISTWPKRHHFFSESVIAMYHMNFVRSDFGSKLRNSSTTDMDFLTSIYQSISSWNYPNSFEFKGKGTFYLKKVANEFETFDPGEDSFVE